MKEKPTFVGYFTKGLILGEKSATKAGQRYIIDLCYKILAMQDIETIKRFCSDTIEIHKKALADAED